MKFYWFDERILNEYLQNFYQDTEIRYHKMEPRYRKLYKINKCFSTDPWGMLHDITDNVPNPFNVITKTPYHWQSEIRDFGTICLETAQDISKRTDRDIAVLWSGGIDSTAALTAFLEILPSERLTVVCNQHSQDEAPQFFQDRIQGKLRTISSNAWAQRQKHYFSVSGDGGDTVWGVIDDSFYQRHSTNMHQPWQDVIDREKFDDLDFVEELCSWSGVDIHSWLDLRVWFYLCCKWQDKCCRIFNVHNRLTDQNAASFYDTAEFQHWTMNNLDKIIGDRWQDYKIPAKQFIYQYHRDRDYFENKTKVRSVSINSEMSQGATKIYWSRPMLPQDYSLLRPPSWPNRVYNEMHQFYSHHGLIPEEFLAPGYHPLKR